METWKDGCLVLDDIEGRLTHFGNLVLDVKLYPYDDNHILACDSAQIANNAIKKMVGDV